MQRREEFIERSRVENGALNPRRWQPRPYLRDDLALPLFASSAAAAADAVHDDRPVTDTRGVSPLELLNR